MLTVSVLCVLCDVHDLHRAWVASFLGLVHDMSLLWARNRPRHPSVICV